MNNSTLQPTNLSILLQTERIADLLDQIDILASEKFCVPREADLEAFDNFCEAFHEVYEAVLDFDNIA